MKAHFIVVLALFAFVLCAEEAKQAVPEDAEKLLKKPKLTRLLILFLLVTLRARLLKKLRK